MQSAATIPKNILKNRHEADQIPFHIHKWNPLMRFRQHIETKPWEKGHLLNEGLDSLCQYLLATAFLCFLLPVILMTVK